MSYRGSSKAAVGGGSSGRRSVSPNTRKQASPSSSRPARPSARNADPSLELLAEPLLIGFLRLHESFCPYATSSRPNPLFRKRQTRTESGVISPPSTSLLDQDLVNLTITQSESPSLQPISILDHYANDTMVWKPTPANPLQLYKKSLYHKLSSLASDMIISLQVSPCLAPVVMQPTNVCPVVNIPTQLQERGNSSQQYAMQGRYQRPYSNPQLRSPDLVTRQSSTNSTGSSAHLQPTMEYTKLRATSFDANDAQPTAMGYGGAGAATGSWSAERREPHQQHFRSHSIGAHPTVHQMPAPTTHLTPSMPRVSTPTLLSPVGGKSMNSSSSSKGNDVGINANRSLSPGIALPRVVYTSPGAAHPQLPISTSSPTVSPRVYPRIQYPSSVSSTLPAPALVASQGGQKSPGSSFGVVPYQYHHGSTCKSDESAMLHMAPGRPRHSDSDLNALRLSLEQGGDDGDMVGKHLSVSDVHGKYSSGRFVNDRHNITLSYPPVMPRPLSSDGGQGMGYEESGLVDRSQSGNMMSLNTGSGLSTPNIQPNSQQTHCQGALAQGRNLRGHMPASSAATVLQQHVLATQSEHSSMGGQQQSGSCMVAKPHLSDRGQGESQMRHPRDCQFPPHMRHGQVQQPQQLNAQPQIHLPAALSSIPHGGRQTSQSNLVRPTVQYTVRKGSNGEAGGSGSDIILPTPLKGNHSQSPSM